MRVDNSHHLVAAARQRALDTRERAERMLRRMDAAGRLVTIGTVAREAGVSRSWLYAQQDLRAEIQRLRGHQPSSTGPVVHACQRASDASLRCRLEAAGAELRRLREENRQLREQLAWALGEHRAAQTRGQPVTPPGNRSGSARPIGPCS
jgi:Family of unknown function (DUF6262)